MTVTVDRGVPAQVVVEQSEPFVVGIVGRPEPAQVGVVAGVPGPPGQSTGVPGPAGQPRWAGQGPPGTIIGAAPGDIYLDELTGTLYTLT